MQFKSLGNVGKYPSVWSRILLKPKQMVRTFNSSSLLTYNSLNSSHLLIVKINPNIIINNKFYINYNNINNNINNTINKINLNNNKIMDCQSIRKISSKSMPESSESSNEPEVTTDDEDLFHEPPRVRFGMFKILITIGFGTYFGALFAMFGANFLEEYEIFVKGDDEEDD